MGLLTADSLQYGPLFVPGEEPQLYDPTEMTMNGLPLGVHDAMHKIVRPIWHPFKSLPPSVGGDASAPLSPNATSPIRFEDWSDDHYNFFLSRKGYDNLMRLV